MTPRSPRPERVRAPRRGIGVRLHEAATPLDVAHLEGERALGVGEEEIVDDDGAVVQAIGRYTKEDREIMGNDRCRRGAAHETAAGAPATCVPKLASPACEACATERGFTGLRDEEFRPPR